MIVLLKCSGKFLKGNITTFVNSYKHRRINLRKLIVLSICLMCLCFGGTASAGFDRTAQPASLQGSAQASIFAEDSESILLNPSAVASLNDYRLSVFYTPSPFALPQLSNYGLVAVYPGDPVNVALSATTIGFSLYREISAAATVGRSFEGVFSAGISVNVDHVAVARYGSATALGIDIAAAAQLSDGVRWGFSLLNVNRPRIVGAADQVPALYITGVTVRLMPTAEISFSLIKDIIYPASIRTGVDFCPIDILQLRVGISTEPSRYCAGFGVRVSSVSFDYAVITHQELGLTHSLGVSLTF